MLDCGRAYARFGGVLYLLIFAAALFGEVFVSGALVVDGNAVATAGKIRGAEELWRLGIAAEVFTLLCDVAVAWILYVLLRSAGKNVALLAAFFRLTYVAVYAPAIAANILALWFVQEHLDRSAMFALRAHDMAFTISLVFFGVHLALAGYLIGRAPLGVKWLSIALEIGGACYAFNSFAVLIAPSLHAVVFPWILLPPFVGELSLAFWLLSTRRFLHRHYAAA